MMDWTKVSSTIGSTAPLLAGLVGGPIGLGVTAASTILSHVLGTTNDPASVTAALEDPAALDKVRQAENANSVQLQQLAVTAAQAQLTQQIELARVDAADRKDARDMSVTTRDWVPKALAIAVTVGFFGIMLLMTLHETPQPNRDLVNIILGSLGTAWISIIGYYFGTSAGSARKTELMAQQSAPVTADSSTISVVETTSKAPSVPSAPALARDSDGDSLHPAFMGGPAPGAQGPSFSAAG